MSVPEEVRQLAEERAQARQDKDFARADELRDLIDAVGWKVVDTADGFDLVEKPPFDAHLSLADAMSGRRVTAELVIAVLLDGWPEDVGICLDALNVHAPTGAVILIMDCGNVDGVGLVAEKWASKYPGRFHVVHLTGQLTELGWSRVVSAAIELSSCDYFALMDISTIVEGSVFELLIQECASPGVVVSGWQGVNVDLEDNWRSFVPSTPGEVDAVLGYLMVFDRKAIEQVRAHEKARFYRNADMEWCLALREAGGRIRVPEDPLAVRQGRHHGYYDSDPAYRDQQSKKTYDRILQRFRGRVELLAPR
jgi:hypothetical protein